MATFGTKLRKVILPCAAAVILAASPVWVRESTAQLPYLACMLNCENYLGNGCEYQYQRCSAGNSPDCYARYLSCIAESARGVCKSAKDRDYCHADNLVNR